MAQLQVKFADLYRQHGEAQAALDQAVSDAKKSLNCPTCTLSDKMDLVKPSETPKK
jgi:hypothetical protein